MDLLLGAAPRPAPAAASGSPEAATDLGEASMSSAESRSRVEAGPRDGHAPSMPLEETGELAPAENTAPERPAPIFAEQESPVGEVAAAETPGDEVVEGEPLATSEPAVIPPAPKTRRPRRRAAAAATSEESSASEPAGLAGSTELAKAVDDDSPLPVETPAGRRRREPDEVLEPAYIPMKITVSIPAVVLSELIRTVQTIRRMTGRRQPVNQGTVIAAALEMAFEEFRTKGTTSQLVDKLRIE